MQPGMIHAPWTPQQVEALNRWQMAGTVHPFTCGTNHEGDSVLIARSEGWVCPTCGYRQLWALPVMLTQPPVIPF